MVGVLLFRGSSKVIYKSTTLATRSVPSTYWHGNSSSTSTTPNPNDNNNKIICDSCKASYVVKHEAIPICQ